MSYSQKRILISSFEKLEHPLVTRNRFESQDMSPPMSIKDHFQPSFGIIDKLHQDKTYSFQSCADFKLKNAELTKVTN